MEAELQSGMGEVRDRIQAWRAARTALGPMPSSLWAEVITLAKGLGIHTTSRALGLNPTRIRARMQRESGQAPSSLSGFLELSVAEVSVPSGPISRTRSTPSGDTVIELSSGHGQRLTIRLGAGQPLDLTGLVRAFRD